MTINTAVAVTDQICRTILYLAGITGFVKLAKPFLARAQVSGPKYLPQETQQPVPPAGAVAAVDGQGKQEARQ